MICECEKTLIVLLTRKQFIHWPKLNNTFDSKKLKNNDCNDVILLNLENRKRLLVMLVIIVRKTSKMSFKYLNSIIIVLRHHNLIIT